MELIWEWDLGMGLDLFYQWPMSGLYLCILFLCYVHLLQEHTPQALTHWGHTTPPTLTSAPHILIPGRIHPWHNTLSTSIQKLGSDSYYTT